MIAGVVAAVILLRRKKKRKSSKSETSVSYLYASAGSTGENVTDETNAQKPPAIYDEIQEPHGQVDRPNNGVTDQGKRAVEYENTEFHRDSKYQGLGPLDTTPTAAYEEL